MPYQCDAVLLRPEQIARLTLNDHASLRLRVLDRADEELELAQEVRRNQAKDDRRKPTANEAFPRFLRTELYQRCAAKEEPEHVRHHIVTHDHRHGHDEPDQPFENVLYDQVALRDDDQQRHVRPGEQAELLHVVLLHQGQHEPDKADAVQTERQEAMVLD